MSNVYSLDQLRADMDTKYAPVEIDLGGESVVLRNMLRLPKEDRKAVKAAIGTVNSDEESEDEATDDMLDAIHTILRLVADNKKGNKLVAAVGEDLALGMHILTLWMEATQPGEAENSPS